MDFSSADRSKPRLTTSPLEFYCKFFQVPVSVLHVGAHLAEELEAYQEFGIAYTCWVEARPDLYERILRRVGSDSCRLGAVWSVGGLMLPMGIANNSLSSSLFSLESLKWPDITMADSIRVRTTTIDELVLDLNSRALLREPSFLLLDVQGAEYEAILGAKERLRYFSAISCEVTRGQGYVGAKSRWRIVLILLRNGYIPAVNFLDPYTGHGDTLFIKFFIALRFPLAYDLARLTPMLRRLRVQQLVGLRPPREFGR